MGRTAGSKNRPREIGIGDNSEERTPEHRRGALMHACNEISQLKDEAASVAARIRASYKIFKAEGIAKGDIDFALFLKGKEEAEVIALAKRTAEIIAWIHPNTQAELDLDQAAE